MTALRELARAKLNLTLEVLGRRADGFHEIRSLVAFTRVGDTLEFAPGNGLKLAVEGPFAGALSGDNVITRAAEAAKAANPGLRLGRFRLDKALPVAAGLGGGSADAAAALRLIARANGGVPSEPDLTEFATKLGSDVSVCLKSKPALITGRGEKVELVRSFPSCGVLLANPRVPLATAAVYGLLEAEPLASLPAQEPQLPEFGGSFEKLVAYILPRGNHLEPPAARLVPEIREVLAVLLALPGARVPRLSGSGPTCFALFATEDEARQATATLGAQHCPWWVAASALLPSLS
jgi:4-diphosphocytidyl-2-C-methyl-D-erythritol kinase